MKGRAPKTGYSRDAFGPAWADVAGNGCDTRNDVLRRDLTATRTLAGTGGCEVASGTLVDPYSGTTIAFTRGAATSTAVRIDHVVALSDAWQTGAFTWTPDKRKSLANDPLNLLAVQSSLNEANGDGDAATWLPPDKAERCAYVARQVAVKTAYGLWVTPAEQQATTPILGGCAGQTLPPRPAPSRRPSTRLRPSPPPRRHDRRRPWRPRRHDRKRHRPRTRPPARHRPGFITRTVPPSAPPARPHCTAGTPDTSASWTATASPARTDPPACGADRAHSLTGREQSPAEPFRSRSCSSGSPRSSTT